MCSRLGIAVILLQCIHAFPNTSVESDPGTALMEILMKPYAVENPISMLCWKHSLKYVQAFKELQPWALKMYDASSHIPSGVLEGNIRQLGNYDQCLHVDAGDFRGQLCSVAAQFYINESTNFFHAMIQASGVEWEDSITATYNWAFCIPSSCGNEDIQNDMKQKLKQLMPHQIQINCQPHQEDTLAFSAAEIAMLALIGVTVLLLVCGTSFDLINRYNINKEFGVLEKVLLCFSLYKNGRSLLGMNNNTKGQITCLYGLRFLSIVWIVFGHTYYMMVTSPNINLITVKYIDRDLSKMLLMNGTLATDTFFMIGGTVLALTFLRSRERGIPFNIGIFYLHRYIRLTVPYAFVVFFYATLLYRLGSGPLWDSVVGVNRDYCISNWWTNLLCINNYVGVERMCMNQTWYLSVDMQLYWLSPLLLLPLCKWPQHRYKVLFSAVVIAVLIPFSITYYYKLTAAMLYNKDQVMLGNVFKEVYLKVYTRMGPYIVGIATGFILHGNKDKLVYISRKKVFAAWVMTLLVCTTILLGVYRFYQPEYEYDVLEASLYGGLYRTVWSVGMAWIVFACVNGYGGPVNEVLSWRAMVPLSNLTYCVYLCHYIVLIYKEGSTRVPGYITDFRAVQEFAGNLLISLVLAAIIALSYELPSINLDKMLVEKLQACCSCVTKEVVKGSEREPSVYIVSQNGRDSVELKKHVRVRFDERVDSREWLRPETVIAAEESDPVCPGNDVDYSDQPENFENRGFI